MPPSVPHLFDTNRRRKIQSRMSSGESLFLLEHLSDEVSDRITSVNRSFTNGLIIAHPLLHAHLRTALASKVEHLTLISDFELGEGRSLDTDDLALAPQTRDLIAIIGTLHCVNDLPGWFHQIKNALRPDGLMIAGFPGGETLASFRHHFTALESELTGGVALRIHPFVSLHDLASLLQRAGFALPVVDHDPLTVRYRSIGRLLDDYAIWVRRIAWPADTLCDALSLWDWTIISARMRQTPTEKFPFCLIFYLLLDGRPPRINHNP